MSRRFEFSTTSLSGLYSITRKEIKDSRGFFARFYCAEEFKEIGVHQPIAQMNHTQTRQKGALRGMHFQHPPHSETKIVTCIKGEIFDVAVDLRQGSPTFLQWHAEILSDKAQNSLCIPDGFAHGFQTLSDDCELLYIHTNFYQADAEDGLNAQDPRLSIAWPLAITEMSERDQKHPMITHSFSGVSLA